MAQPLQLGIVVVALVLQPGGQGDQGQVVGVHHIVDVTGEAQGELRHRDEEALPPPARCP